jgi:repressor of nif and glnA expression
MKKKEDDLKKEIIEILKKEDNPVSTQDIADKLARPWHSIQTRCLMLQIQKQINGFRVGRVNLWQIK